MLGVGGTRSNISRGTLRGGNRGARIGGTQDASAQKRELLRKLREKREGDGRRDDQG